MLLDATLPEINCLGAQKTTQQALTLTSLLPWAALLAPLKAHLTRINLPALRNIREALAATL